MEKIKVSIIGCCVCRDLFEDEADNFEFLTDIRFCSPISLISKPVDYIHADFDHFKKKAMDVNGRWFKKTLINDINKTALSSLEERHGDYLIIDFSEARMSIANCVWPNQKEKLTISYSSTFRKQYRANLKNNVFKNVNFEIIPPHTIKETVWKETLQILINRLLKIFKEENIILIEDMPAKYYVAQNGELQNFTIPSHFQDYLECNLLSPKLNELFKKMCPKSHSIKMIDYALGSSNHKWGTNPFHYTKTVYSYLLESVKAIIKKEDKKLQPIYEEYTIKARKEYEKAMNLTIENYYKKRNGFDYLEVINSIEEFKNIGRKKKAWILFGLNKKDFLKNIKKL